MYFWGTLPARPMYFWGTLKGRKGEGVHSGAGAGRWVMPLGRYQETKEEESWQLSI